MATQVEFQEQMDRLNAATSALAQKLTDLQGQIEGAGLPSEVEDAVLAQLKGVADTLEAMGKAPEMPETEA